MNKREIILSLLESENRTPYIPAAFFLHFDPSYHRGQAAVDKHVEFFEYTGMDFVKIQYEVTFPLIREIQKPQDWVKMPFLRETFFEDQWRIAKGLVDAAGKEAMVIMTLYSPLMCAGQVVGRDVLTQHIQEDPEKVKVGMEIITESLMNFVKGCIQRGIDGFYHSTQGGETFRFEGSHLFETCVKPYDLALMEEINNSCDFNILHICDYHGGYADLSPFLDYPGDVVNCSLNLGSRRLTPKEVSQMFKRPFMGGMDRKGILVTGSKDEIVHAINEVIKNSPDDFILGADCTLPGNMDWETIKSAISYTHNFNKA